jgi:spore germination cell wall hydrolase CwlJ-like protein
MNWEDYFKSLLSLVLWREAADQGHIGMRAVAHVIRNRVLATHLPFQWEDVISAKWQFSSITAPGDPMLIKWPKQPDVAFEDAMQIAESVYNGSDEDPTGGATMYANLRVCSPKWDFSKLTQTAVIGAHTFWKTK